MRGVFVVLSTLGPLAILSACETMPQPGDRTPPVVTITEVNRDLPVVYTTDVADNRDPARTGCETGSPRSFDPSRLIDRNLYYVLQPGQDRIELLITMNDPSGIAEAFVQVGRDSDPMATPAPVLETNDRGRQSFIYRFTETGTLRTAKTYVIDIAVDGPPTSNAVFISATDGAGNRTAAASGAFIGTYQAECG